MKKKILIVDDEEMIIHTVKVILEDFGYEVHGERDPSKGEAEALSNAYDLIILDLRMPGKNGAEITESIIKHKPTARILIHTGYPTDPLAKKAIDAGAAALIKKPTEIGKILDFLTS